MNETLLHTLALSPFEHRPKKRAKLEPYLRATISLNADGIAALERGHLHHAEKIFSQALCRVDVNFLCQSIQLSLDSFISNIDASEGSTSSSKDAQPQDGQLVYINKKGKGDLGDEKSSTLIYVHQQHEYDEGLSSFETPIAATESSNSEIVCRVLFYNIGLTHSRRGDYAGARAWFQRTLSSFEFSGVQSDLHEVQTLHNIGLCSYRMGNNLEAMKYYTQALARSAQLPNQRVRARAEAASQNSLGVLYFHRHADDGEKAINFFKQSLVLFQKACGNDSAEVATVLNNIGRVYYLQAEHEQALQIYGEALRIRRIVLEKDSIDVAATVYNFGQTYHQLGYLTQAMTFYHEFLELAKKKLGIKCRDVAIVYRCIGEIYHEQGKLKEGLEVFKKALEIGRVSLGRSHPEIASCLNKLGNLCYQMKDHECALRYYQDGLKVEQRILQSSHPHIIITLTNMAHIYKNQGEYGLALSAYRQVHIKQVETYGDLSIECATTLSSVGLMQYHMKFYDEALESYQQALRIRRDTYSDDNHVDIASTLNSIGLVLFKQNVLDMSRHCFSKSLKIRLKLLGKDHRDVAILWYNIATIYFEMGEEEMAIKLYKETLRVERISLGVDHADVVLTLQHIGQVFQQIGKLDEALKYFQDALDIEQTRKDGDQISLAKILNLIGNIHLQRCNVPEMMAFFVDASRIYEGCHLPGETLVIAGYNFYGLTKLHPECAPVA